ncbi:MAG: TspO/MBR family protein [Pseudomonadota bacterium]
MPNSLATLLFFFAITFLASASGAIFKPDTWYADLKKPLWTPPNWLFPIVWMILFSAMAIASWLVWESSDAPAVVEIGLYTVHLFINATWSFFFFGRKRLDLAMVNVVALWVIVAVLIFVFAPINQLAAVLLVPYLAWVTLAAALNMRLLMINGARGDLNANHIRQQA